MQCVMAREVWHICRETLELNIEEPGLHNTNEDWWVREHARLRGLERKELYTLMCLISYALEEQKQLGLQQCREAT
jgi:hypothetical protein